MLPVRWCFLCQMIALVGRSWSKLQIWLSKKKIQFSVSFKHYVFLFSILINKGFFISIKTVEIILLSSLLCENMEEFHELDTFWQVGSFEKSIRNFNIKVSDKYFQTTSNRARISRILTGCGNLPISFKMAFDILHTVNSFIKGIYNVS